MKVITNCQYCSKEIISTIATREVTLALHMREHPSVYARAVEINVAIRLLKKELHQLTNSHVPNFYIPFD